MSRHNKQINDHIYIAYGYDEPLQGYFIQIYDSRLEWEEDKSDQENAKAMKTDLSGCGEIDSYATNNKLISKNVVGKNRILEILEKYNVDKEHCMCVAIDQPIPQ